MADPAPERFPLHAACGEPGTGARIQLDTDDLPTFLQTEEGSGTLQGLLMGLYLQGAVEEGLDKLCPGLTQAMVDTGAVAREPDGGARLTESGTDVMASLNAIVVKIKQRLRGEEIEPMVTKKELESDLEAAEGVIDRLEPIIREVRDYLSANAGDAAGQQLAGKLSFALDEYYEEDEDMAKPEASEDEDDDEACEDCGEDDCDGDCEDDDEDDDLDDEDDEDDDLEDDDEDE